MNYGIRGATEPGGSLARCSASSCFLRTFLTVGANLNANLWNGDGAFCRTRV